MATERIDPLDRLLPGLSKRRLPEFLRVRQQIATPSLTDPSGALMMALRNSPAVGRIQPWQRVAVAVGSRGIARLPELVRATVQELRARGAEVFIVPAMGSHGGGTAQGQRDVLAKLGVTEATCGAPVQSAMETRVIGRVPVPGSATRSIEVHVDATALAADWIVPIARIKPHTGFRGPIESGLCKMLSIGLAKHVGCAALHREGYAAFPELVPSCASVVLDTGKIPFGIAVLENAREEIAALGVIGAEEFLQREPGLLNDAKALLPRLPLQEIDVLVVDEIGKDISGTGMDSNITGRGLEGVTPGYNGPKISRIAVLGLSVATQGNANGIGQADLITQKCLNQINMAATATNALSSGSIANAKIPIALPNDDACIMAAAACIPGVPFESARIVRIKNTLKLEEFAISENCRQLVELTPGCEFVGPFDGKWHSHM